MQQAAPHSRLQASNLGLAAPKHHGTNGRTGPASGGSCLCLSLISDAMRLETSSTFQLASLQNLGLASFWLVSVPCLLPACSCSWPLASCPSCPLFSDALALLSAGVGGYTNSFKHRHVQCMINDTCMILVGHTRREIVHLQLHT